MLKQIGMLAFLAVSAAALSATADEVRPMGPGGPGLPGKDDRCVPSLEVDKDAPREVKVGDFFTYTITLTNTGTCDLRGIRLVDRLPERVKFEDASPDPDDVDEGLGGEFGGRVVWEDISLRAGESEEFEIEVHVVGPPNRTIVNQACATDTFIGRVCDRTRTRVETGGTANR